MLGRLPQAASEAVASYCANAFGSSSYEVATCLQAAAELCPDGLRVKELLESFEAYREIAAFVHDAGKLRPIDVIYDIACGHGIVGILLAYRFPQRRVECVDLSQRDVFEALVNAFQKHGEAAEGETVPLSNLNFNETDFTTLDLRERSMLVAVHACNELNRQVIDAARNAGATWAVLPCCVRAGTYLSCRVGGAIADDDDTKHVLNCGVVAGRYGAERLQTIDRRITNRNILICGGAGFQDYDDVRQICSQGRPPTEGPDAGTCNRA